MIHYKKGDLFEGSEDIIAQGCNCKGIMGSGVAKIVREKHPKAYRAYVELYKREGLELGTVQFVNSNSTRWIANCMTQYDFLPRNICHANYDAIRSCMIALKKWAKPCLYTIAIPKIGAGLAGGDWKIIEKILEEVFTDYDITVYEL